MANKLTSEGLTVGSYTLTNIAQDWGGGFIFCGFKYLSNPSTQVDSDVLPDIEVGQYKYCYVPSSMGKPAKIKVTLPSSGWYQWCRGDNIILCPMGIYSVRANGVTGMYGISSGGSVIYSYTGTNSTYFREMICYLRIL